MDEGYDVADYCGIDPVFGTDADFVEMLEERWQYSWPKPRVIVLSFPHNPTTSCVDLAFMQRVVDFCRERDMIVVHDFAYADITFDGYEAPSLLQVPGAKEVGVEIVSVGVRDVILPGDMKDLMNKVTEAKKAAEANLIARREETAAMRSQANTAKLLSDNPTLMRLRELEVLEKIATASKLNVVLGEKGSGKTAMRLQIARHLERYNDQHPERRNFVIHYDDFNPFLDRFRQKLHGRRRSRALSTPMTRSSCGRRSSRCWKYPPLPTASAH